MPCPCGSRHKFV
ncbi:MAG: SEC-C domain-containing protein [Burkholderiales bacterium]|nr:SEC-C domain-containing protein [Bacteroidales bacterium]MCZ2417945.1 SEC-C domain-containing protein [Burkholderiales bacterium]